MGDINGSPARDDRRGSFGRTFTKVKDALRRRSLGGRKSISEEAPVSSGADSSHPISPVDYHPENAVMSPAAVGDHVPAQSDVHHDTWQDEALAVDDDEDGVAASYGPGSVGPIHSIRSKYASTRAKTLFEKYGIKYEEGDRELTDGTRRVEKAIRIRIHWACHECKSSFTGRKTCAKCGHKRCADCVRAPAKRVKEMLGGTEVMEEIKEKAAELPPEKDSVVVPVATGAAIAGAATAGAATAGIIAAEDHSAADGAGTARALSPEDTSESATDKLPGDERLPEFEAQGTMERDEVGEDGEIDVTQFQYSMQHRPKSGVRLVLKPKARYIRRTCHQCHTNFTPKSRRKCLSCGHDRCNDCQSDATQFDEATDLKTGEERMVGTVDRVYRKARQRVRWTCHECETTFVGRADCANCGHKRCETCTRSPGKHVPVEPDPEVVASVTRKLGSLRGPSADVPASATKVAG